ncbi:hypothetical protein V8D89_006738 [Ganoderma adspersum]
MALTVRNCRLSVSILCAILLATSSKSATLSGAFSITSASSFLGLFYESSNTSVHSVTGAVSSISSLTSSAPELSAATKVTSIVSVASIADTTTDSAPATTLITLLISSYPFSSFPVPTASAIPGVFPSTSPSSPPPPGSRLIPDFGPAWAEAKAKPKKLVSGWTLEQKVNVPTGVGLARGRCIGNIAAVGDWPGLCLEDGPLGVRQSDFVTAFPAGINAAATWNRTLIRARGKAIGQEFKGKGVNVGLGPMMNITRVPQAGRNWEGFGADPYLAGEAAYETVLGWQEGGAQACAKHFINNEQEHLREHESSHVDDRTEHEIYVHPFMRSVQAGVASVLCGYTCENDRTLNQILKGELGFQGYVMSDWGGHHSTLAAVAGLDMSMPGDIAFVPGTSWWGANLTAFVENGTIAEARVDDMAERIVAAWIDELHTVNFNGWLPNDPATNAHVDMQGDHFKLVREIGAASANLLKNVAGALPLRAPRSLAIIVFIARPCEGCATQAPCRNGLQTMLESAVASDGASDPDILRTWRQTIDEWAQQHGLCDLCRRAAIERDVEARQAVWDSLPAIFDLDVEGWIPKASGRGGSNGLVAATS